LIIAVLLTSEELPPLWEVGFFESEDQVLSDNPAGLYVYTQSINMKAALSNYSLYAQDEWKATPRMSASLGVRWDLNPPPTDVNGNTPYTRWIRLPIFRRSPSRPGTRRCGRPCTH
jgi:hypothetical protein